MTPNGKLLKDTMAGLNKPSKPAPKNSGLLSKTITCQGCGHSWKSADGGADPFTCHKCGDMVEMAKGGYVVSRSSDRKGKTHKVTGPDGTVKYFGDSKLGQHPKDPERKAAFYARHKKNLDGNPYFRAFARKTWADGGQTNDDREMLEGVADILRRIKDEQNRKQIANYMMNNFREENVSFQPNQFLEEANVYAQGGQMIKRADGSYSRRGMWDNIRANKGSGKKPTKEMLAQERKIRSQEKSNGGPINNQNMHSIYDMMPHLAGGGTNNPGFNALPPYVQAKILANMGYGGYHNPYMAGGGNTFYNGTWYGNGGYYPMYDEAGPVDPNGQWHGEWASDPMLADQFGYPAQGPTEDEIIASQDAANVAANPMAPTKINVQAPAKKAPAAAKRGSSAGSVVDFLNSQGAQSDFATRKNVAEKIYGIGNYRGTEDQNKMLLQYLKGQRKPGQGSGAAPNMNDGNMLRKGYDAGFDNRYPQFGSPRPGVPSQSTPAPVKGKEETPKKLPGKKKPLFGQTADEFIQNDPYFFAEESDGKFVKALDYPFTMLRNAGARVVLDQDPVAAGELLLAGLMSRGLIGRTQTYPYGFPKGPKGLPGGASKALPGPGPRQIAAPRPVSSPRPGGPSGGYMEFGKDFAPRLGPQGFQTGSGMRSPGFPMYASGGYAQGQEMDVTPAELEMLKAQGYQFEII